MAASSAILKSARQAWSTRPPRLLRPFGSPNELDGLQALLVTDLEGFTPLVEKLGDASAQRIIQDHNRLLRARLEQRNGREMAHTGDGVVASFRSIARALQCAAEMQCHFADYNRSQPLARLQVRMGVHAGEPLPEEGRLFGHCVNLAVRVCGAAPPGSVLVTDVVKQLSQGRGFAFSVGRAHMLKGVSCPVQLYEYAWA